MGARYVLGNKSHNFSMTRCKQALGWEQLITRRAKQRLKLFHDVYLSRTCIPRDSYIFPPHYVSGRVDHIYKVREYRFKEELQKNPTLMIFGLWLVTVLGISLAVVFGLVSCIFAIVNSVMTPVEAITGRAGLYLWNIVGGLFCLVAIISWMVQFFLKLSHNVMTQDEQNDKWTSDGRASLGYSFYFLVVTLVLFSLNVCILVVASLQPWGWKKPKHITPKNPEGVIMLY
ncbi:hypothetical protein HPB51_021867 [Rhipicephalus microplus]|uniref:Uncharacterized protein n=1 Tax=Rhipicephalus microplus TaxID=6941 RepID=A0A9J6DCR3_RHIMP|nr:hypothetical protein HPB51_021867 [Rhipicephalus microplus]